MRPSRSLWLVLGALGIAPLTASAGDNAECYTSQGKWNAPAGALVLSRSAGNSTVGAVTGGVGEYFTHTVYSHGADWGSMATMREPRTYPDGDSSCSAPIEPHDMANGWPGNRTDDPGGLWSFYFSSGGFMNGQSDLRYIVAGGGYTYNFGSDAYASNYGTDWDVADCTQRYEKAQLAGSSGCGSNSPGPGCTGPIPYGYSVYSYSQYTNFPSGYGTMCSGLISWSLYHGTGGNKGAYWCHPGTQTSYTYPNSLVVNSANALYNQINSGSQGFFESIGTFFMCFDTNLIDEAADQAVKCFTNNQGTSCTQGGHDWADNNVYGHTATSISPDRLGGYNAAGYDANNNSPWKPYYDPPLQFNQPGNTYGCWY